MSDVNIFTFELWGCHMTMFIDLFLCNFVFEFDAAYDLRV